jgi:hypothetical protein
MTVFGSILTAFIAGACALIGAVLGSRTERKARHQAWLLEKRAEVFAEFLSRVHSYIKEAIALETRGDLAKRRRRLIDMYLPVRDQATIVRLFLEEDRRGEFSTVVEELYDICCQGKLSGREKYSAIARRRTQIQRMFEDQLKSRERETGWSSIFRWIHISK